MNPAPLAESGSAPPYPEGWFQVGYSDDVTPGQVVRLRYFGRELALFRTESGVAQVLDGFCAHIGAHLAVGGQVVGERLRCPFHAWEYGSDGRCKAIPYSPQIPPGAAIGAWPTEERSGLILMWHSPVGAPPHWEPPELAEYGDAAWSDYVRYGRVIHTTIQEVGENVADTAHGLFVHGGAQGPEQPTWAFDFDGHRRTAQIHKYTPSMGGVFTHTVESYGLGLSLNRSTAHLPGGQGRKCFWSTNTPIDSETVEVRFSMLAARSSADDPTGELSRHSAQATFREFEKDIPIWENKAYLPNPLLCKGDGPIGRFRIWARQFYPELASGPMSFGHAGRAEGVGHPLGEAGAA